LLVPPERLRASCSWCGTFDPERVDVAREFLALAAQLHEAIGGEPVENWAAEVLANRMPRMRPWSFAIFGEQANTGGNRIARGADGEGLAIELDVAGVALVGAEDETTTSVRPRR